MPANALHIFLSALSNDTSKALLSFLHIQGASSDRCAQQQEASNLPTHPHTSYTSRTGTKRAQGTYLLIFYNKKAVESHNACALNDVEVWKKKNSIFSLLLWMEYAMILEG